MECTTILCASAGLVGLLVLFLVYKRYSSKKRNFWADKNLPYVRPPPFKIFASFFTKKNYWDVDADWCRENGRIFGCFKVGEPCLYVTDPEVVRRILVKDFHLLPDHRTFKTNDPIADCFLSVMEGDDWKRVRSVITPAFSTGRLKKMIRLMNECAVITAGNLTQVAEKDGLVDCKAIFGGFTMDVIASTAFGIELNSSRDPENVFVQHARQFFNLSFPWRLILAVVFPKLSVLLGIGAFDPKLMKFFIDLTNTAVQKRKESKEDRGDFLQNLMEAQARGASEEYLSLGEEATDVVDKDAPSEECKTFLKQYAKNKTLSTEEFVASCVVFFLGGYDTTATAISMTTYFLALNPDCQEKVVKEVDEIWKNYPDMDYEALNKAKYLEAAISETLRLVPPAPRLARKALQDYPIPEANFTLPKDMVVEIPIFAMHTDPEFFPNPEKYDPDRFLPEFKDSIRPYTYLPFGAGPRNCLGMRFAYMEIKFCLLHVFREVTFEPYSQTKIPPEIYKGSGLYQPKTVNLKVIKRSRK